MAASKQTYETEVGQMTLLVPKNHNTAASATTRIVNAVANLQEFGSKFNKDLENECISVIEQIKGINLKTLPLNDWREWTVTDEPSSTMLFVRIRRTS
jgi:hypothetical protein